MSVYSPKKEPWAHQREALAKMDGAEAFALLMGMRTGKTKTLLDDYGRLEDRGDAQDLAVLAPGGVYRTWEKGIEEHVGNELRTRLRVFTWVSGKTSRKYLEETEAFLAHDGPRILLMNVEAISAGAKGAKELLIAFLEQRSVVVAVDESTVIKTPGSQRTKFIVRKVGPLAEYRRILSGLPTPKSPMDLFSQFEFLDARILRCKSWYVFRAKYAVLRSMQMAGRSFKVIVGFRNLDELSKLIKPYSYRITLEECYDVPQSAYIIREVELTKEQKKAYDEIKKFATTEIVEGKHVTATIVIAQMTRLHQILCGHVGTEEGEVIDVPENRTKELMSVLEEYSGKAIIWCSYNHDVQKVVARLRDQARREDPEWEIAKLTRDARLLAHVERRAEEAVARFWGGNRNTREEEERRFLEDPACRYMVATAAAGGRGRTWTVADLVVYYSNRPDLEHRSQSEERPKGVGKEAKVTYIDLMVRGTVDEKFVKSLRNKIDMAALINGDNYREWLI